MNETVHQLEFLSEYTCNSQRVCHAIPSGILMLFKNNTVSLSSLSLPEPVNSLLLLVRYVSLKKKEEIIK